MKNVKIEYAQNVADYYFIEELVNDPNTNKDELLDNLSKCDDFEIVDVEPFMFDIINKYNAVFTIQYYDYKWNLCKLIEHLDPNGNFLYAYVEDFIELIKKGE
jgi:hypothetical protein